MIILSNKKPHKNDAFRDREVILLFPHQDYSRRCAARDGCVYFRRNLVLVVTPHRTGQHGPRHGCLGWVSLDVGPPTGVRPRLGLPQTLHGHPGGNVFKRVHESSHSIRVPTIIPRILDGMPSRRQRRRRRASSRRPRFRQNGRGIMIVLAKAAKIGYKLGRDKRYKRMRAKGATGHYRRHPRPWEQ